MTTMGEDQFSNLSSLPWLSQQIIEASPVGMLLVDTRHTGLPVVYVNAAFEHATVYSREEIIGPDWICSQDNDHGQSNLGIIRDAIRDKKPCSVAILGSELRLSPLCDTNGRVAYLIGVIDHSPTRQDIDTQRATLTVELEQRLQTQTSELEEANNLLRREIARRERAEEAYRLLVNEAVQGLMIFQDERPVFANPALVNLLGYSLEEYLAFSPEHFWSAIHPDDRATVRTRYQDRMAGKPVSHHYVYRMFHKDGRSVWVEAHVSRITYRGKPAVQVALTDVTNRKDVERTLRTYQAAVEASQDLIMVVDAHYRYVLVNKVYLQYHQREKHEVVGQHVSQTVGEEIFESALKPRLDHCLKGETQSFEMDFYYPGVGRRHPWVNFFPLRDEAEGIIGVVVVIRDITERKQVEEKLRESETRARALLNAIPDIMFRLDRHGRYLDFKAGPSDPDDQLELLVGRTVQDSFPAGLPRLALSHIERALDTQQMQIFEYQLPVDQTLQDYEARMLVSGDDEVTTIVRNITERKRAQQREFDIALEKERVRLLTEFIQNAAHEFKTPLTIINSNAHLIPLIDDPEKRALKGKQIQEQVQRITRLIDMLLKIVKLESTAPPFSPVDVSDLARRICADVGLKKEMVTIRCQIEPSLVVSGDDALLQEAVMALLDNALRFGANGGTITLSLAYANRQAILSVQDEGPGIREEDLPFIFETFWRGDSSHSTPGLGLGLSIARKIAQVHHGNVEVQSKIGQGSVFRLILPAMPTQ